MTKPKPKHYDLIELWTGKTHLDRARMIRESMKIPGSDWRKRLLDESSNYMLEISKRLTDSDIIWTLNEIKTLQLVAGRFGDMLYKERELRAKKKKLDSV